MGRLSTTECTYPPTCMVQQFGGEKPQTDVFASRDAPQLRKCTRHWHKGDSAWSKHWGLKEWGPCTGMVLRKTPHVR